MHAHAHAHYHPPIVVFKAKGQNKKEAMANEHVVVRRLKAILAAKEPEIARWLYDTWNAQQEAIKYQELRDAILNGGLTLDYLKEWQEDYSRFVLENLSPIWLDTMEQAANQLKARFPEWVFDPAWPAVQRWVQDRGTELAVNLAEVQHEALRQVINRAATMGDFGPDELSRCIRPLIGMVPREANAVLRYYEALRKDGRGIKEAQRMAANYAGRVHRHRAFRIARTELAYAFNQGAAEGIRQAQAEGLIGPVAKRWMTADDERVCEICGPLDNKLIGQEDEFDIPYPEKFTGQHKLPPAHPHCRCTVMYEEMEAIGAAPKGPVITEEQLEELERQEGSNTGEYKHIPDSEAQKYNDKLGKTATAKLTEEQHNAIGTYSEEDYDLINTYLRTGTMPKGLTGNKQGQDYIKDSVRVLDSAFDKYKTTENLIVHRGASIEALGFSKVPSEMQINSLIGKKITDKAYMSTSLSAGHSLNFIDEIPEERRVMFEIKAPKGSAALPVSGIVNTAFGFQVNEAEMLFKRGTSLKITDAMQTDEGILIYAEVVP